MKRVDKRGLEEAGDGSVSGGWTRGMVEEDALRVEGRIGRS